MSDRSVRATPASIGAMTGAALHDVIAERLQQVDVHGFTIERDQLTAGPVDLPLAAASYVNAAIDQLDGRLHVGAPDMETWPWAPDAWRPADPRACLVKAAALILAAIDRLDHAAPSIPAAGARPQITE